MLTCLFWTQPDFWRRRLWKRPSAELERRKRIPKAWCRDMRTDQTAPKNIDEYIAGFPHDVQEILEKIRMTIRKAAPDAEETISYQIPTFTLKGRHLVYFAA